VSDDKIIEGCKNNQRKQQKMLLDRYAPYLMSIALRYMRDNDLAKDILQETWVKVFRNIHQYEQGTNLKAWLAKITVNTALRNKQKNTIAVVSNCNKEMQIESDLVTVDDQLAYEDLLKLVDRVKPPSREVFMMAVMDGMSHKEIASAMGIKESTSRVHLTNARKNLRNMLMIAKANSL